MKNILIVSLLLLSNSLWAAPAASDKTTEPACKVNAAGACTPAATTKPLPGVKAPMSMGKAQIHAAQRKAQEQKAKQNAPGARPQGTNSQSPGSQGAPSQGAGTNR